MKKIFINLPLFILLSVTAIGCQQKGLKNMSKDNLEVATLGGGCFWCVEAVYERVEGIKNVVSGYAGGHLKNPTYKEVSRGKTGHTEVCQIHYNPDEISYDEILEIFWKSHDPTTLNRQGNDYGTQYRSAIYYHDNSQKASAESALKNADNMFEGPITTEVKPLDVFYIAEVYHQDYFANNPNAPYCTFVIAPKINKLKKKGTIWDD
ncbi:MAG: peptide-methionine (S)-S-oxide reductase MsrA [Candidatus Marinimicrobia bacterium]|jgi:peptide-methionine (S)-S-oxide reductase|nr:peptide-methionine (S)-S-oxide reductase MsrA [Candidatus Neomarinimicrobiota bacterium]MBT3675138.1 peptide-methionine (S)-S-oxide reductase MsrA [Candidatus Neomarinimicrobiota bacterium]MBT3764051.1 peptide-methionine (S)-S-oxide reductase MsrA [Candidatus Neomarinimicrobiota bacterium]MBT4067662.1 peptide-methionine (S)-S-oxide reductase MsrA [Candidatus Neomarinimicrobiota bacterium]MBT4270334.1 peptide-methionine (S)-S-oxide reductase MsrA [Candidatus Neomarinimicrobiota bacterium]